MRVHVELRDVLEERLGADAGAGFAVFPKGRENGVPMLEKGILRKAGDKRIYVEGEEERAFVYDTAEGVWIMRGCECVPAD